MAINWQNDINHLAGIRNVTWPVIAFYWCFEIHPQQNALLITVEALFPSIVLKLLIVDIAIGEIKT